MRFSRHTRESVQSPLVVLKLKVRKGGDFFYGKSSNENRGVVSEESYSNHIHLEIGGKKHVISTSDFIWCPGSRNWYTGFTAGTKFLAKRILYIKKYNI